MTKLQKEPALEVICKRILPPAAGEKHADLFIKRDVTSPGLLAGAGLSQLEGVWPVSSRGIGELVWKL